MRQESSKFFLALKNSLSSVPSCLIISSVIVGNFEQALKAKLRENRRSALNQQNCVQLSQKAPVAFQESGALMRCVSWFDSMP